MTRYAVEARTTGDGSRGLDAFATIGVVGATGAVGAEALAILAERGVHRDRARAFGSARSAGSTVRFGDGTLEIEEARPESFGGVDLVLLCASSEVSRALTPRAIEAGARVIDNSSAFRQDPDVPLVVPEINGALLTRETRLVANPNCSTIILLLALEPLRRAFGVREIVVSTYQAVSGAGAKAMAELAAQAEAFASEKAIEPQVFREPCLFNVFSHNSPVDSGDGLNDEERKIIAESRRIWDDPGLAISPTCIRVPTMRAHGESIRVTLGRTATEAEVRRAIEGGTGLSVVDDRCSGDFPTPLKASGRDEVLVGRIRPDPGAAIGREGHTDRFLLWVCGDQLRKGAALNAIQIADRLGEVTTWASPGEI